MNIREGVVRSILSNHLEHVSCESSPRLMDIDRVGAFGLASGKLAQFLFHWQASTDDAEQALWLRRAWRVLIRRTAKDFRIRNKGEAGKRSYAVLERACFQMLIEWSSPQCVTCSGVGKVGVKRYEIEPDVKTDDLICDHCGGTGVRRYTDFERMRALNIQPPELEAWGERMALIMVEITKAVSRGVLGTKERLA